MTERALSEVRVLENE